MVKYGIAWEVFSLFICTGLYTQEYRKRGSAHRRCYGAILQSVFGSDYSRIFQALRMVKYFQLEVLLGKTKMKFGQIVYATVLISCRASDAVSLISNSTSEANCPSQYCPYDYPMLTCTTLTSILRWISDVASPATPFTVANSRIGETNSLVNRTNDFEILYKSELTCKSPLTSVLTATSSNVIGSTVWCSDGNGTMMSLYLQLYGGRFTVHWSPLGTNILFPPVPSITAPSSPKNSSEPITYMNGVPRYVHWSPSNDACGDPGTYYQVTGPQGIPVCSHVPGNITSCDISGLSANVSHVDVWTVNCVGKSSPLRILIPSWHTTTSHTLPPSSTPGGSSSGQVS
eukprot:Em0039g22a